MNLELREALAAHFSEWKGRESPSGRLGEFREWLEKEAIDVQPIDVPAVVQLLNRFAGREAGEYFDPPILVDLMWKSLEGRTSSSLLDPAAGFGGLISAAQAATRASRAVAIEINRQALDV